MIVHKYIKDKRNKMNLLFVDLSNQNVEQTASTMSASRDPQKYEYSFTGAYSTFK